MIEYQDKEDIQSKENVLLLNNKSLISKDVVSESNANRRIMNNIGDIK